MSLKLIIPEAPNIKELFLNDHLGIMPKNDTELASDS